MQRIIITIFLFLAASFHAHASMRSDQLDQKTHIGAFSENTPISASGAVLYLVETELGYIAFLEENGTRSKGRFINRDPLGYVDGMSLYGAYFAQGFGLDPWGLWTIDEEAYVDQNATTKKVTVTWCNGEVSKKIIKNFKDLDTWLATEAAKVKKPKIKTIIFEGHNYMLGHKKAYFKKKIKNGKEIDVMVPEGEWFDQTKHAQFLFNSLAKYKGTCTKEIFICGCYTAGTGYKHWDEDDSSNASNSCLCNKKSRKDSAAYKAALLFEGIKVSGYSNAGGFLFGIKLSGDKISYTLCKNGKVIEKDE